MHMRNKHVRKTHHPAASTESAPSAPLASIIDTDLLATYRFLQELPFAGVMSRQVTAQAELSDDYKRQIEQSIQDELADTGFYACIVNEAPNPILRLISQSITGEEFGHARTQAALLSMNPPPLAPPEPIECSGNFVQDVTKARNGEVAAITRYASLAAQAPTPELRYLFTSILTDEYAHSRIWTAMLQAVSGFE